MKIAWFTPFNPRSAIGHYSEIVTRLLSENNQMTIFTSDHEIAPPRRSAFPVRPTPADAGPEFLAELDQFDLAVYNMGDNLAYHRNIYDLMIRRRGIVILHDLVLRDFFFNYFSNDPQSFARALLYSHGDDARDQAEAITSFRHLEDVNDPERLKLPLFRPALHRALGVIVHSQFAAERVSENCASPLLRLDFPMTLPNLPVRSQKKPGRIKILTFGVLNSNKLVHKTIQAIASSDILRKSVSFTVIGEGTSEYTESLRRIVKSANLESVVHLEGFQGDDVLDKCLREADLVVNLRNPQLGESSWSLITALCSGVPAIVWDHGYYGEFPDSVVYKIRSDNELKPALEFLSQESGMRFLMGERARKHAQVRFDPSRYKQQFQNFAANILSKIPALTLIDQVCDILIEFGCGPDDSIGKDLGKTLLRYMPVDAPEMIQSTPEANAPKARMTA